MGEYISTNIRLAGKLKREHVAELADLLNDKGLSFEYHGGKVDPQDIIDGNCDEPGAFYANEVNYGNLDELRAFANEHGLDWEHWIDQCAGECEDITRCVAGVERNSIAANEAPVIPLEDLRKTDNLASGLGILLEQAKWWCEPLGKFEIVP